MPLSDTEILTFIPLIRKHARKYLTLDTDDLVQGALEKILKSKDAYVEGNVVAWMLTIANHHFIDEVRAAGRQPCMLRDESEEAVALSEGETLAAGEDAVALQDAITFLNKTNDGRELMGFVVDGSNARKKMARFRTRQDLKRAMA